MDAETFDMNQIRSVITLLNVRVNEYKGKKNISLIRDSFVNYNQDTIEVKALKEWFESKNNVIIEKMISRKEFECIEYNSITELYKVADKTKVNTIGMVFEVGHLKSFTSEKSKKEFKKRAVTIVDQTETAILMTLWNAQADEFNETYTDSIISIKNGQIVENDGQRFITYISETNLIHNPDTTEAKNLQKWYSNEGKNKLKIVLSKLSKNEE